MRYATRAATLLLLAPVAACARDAPTAPEAVPDEPGTGPPAIVSATASAALRIAVDDMLDRIVPALGHSDGTLRTALTALAAALGEGEADRLRNALRAAEHGVEDLARDVGEEHDADLAVIRLVLEHARALLGSAAGG